MSRTDLMRGTLDLLILRALATGPDQRAGKSLHNATSLADGGESPGQGSWPGCPIGQPTIGQRCRLPRIKALKNDPKEVLPAIVAGGPCVPVGHVSLQHPGTTDAGGFQEAQ